MPNGDKRRAAAEAIGRRVQQCVASGPENADPFPPDLLSLLNGAGFFTRAQVEHVAERIREADRMLDEALRPPGFAPGPGEADGREGPARP